MGTWCTEAVKRQERDNRRVQTINDQREEIDQLQAALQTANEENGRLKEANILLKNGAADYEKQIKKMRRNLRRWCIANHIKLNDEAPDILLDS